MPSALRMHATGPEQALPCMCAHASAVPQKYQSHQIVQLLEELGLDFGACSNAYTSADETVRAHLHMSAINGIFKCAAW